ncbi:MAG: isoleucine--tRNA ligase [Patescibacteria group bacterium]|nr:isoleucine--tRNA ligase [Patescibacteria group bacterium]
MKFKHGTRRRALEYEKDWVTRWKQDKTFEKSVQQRPKDNAYVFYDGPPFISGVPHHGTLLSSIVKDAVPRYQTMKGKRVERVWGWDCHGLPAERFTEKKLGINSRQEVIEYGLEKYIKATRKNMEETSGLWEEYIDRIGRWVDFKGAYKTMDKDYMESIWWAFKTLYEKGKIYEGEKVLMYCTLDGTPLSKAEVTMDAGAYQDVTDPSVYVKFKLKPDQEYAGGKYKTKDAVYIIAWTTTPWTLPANTAIAVNNEIEYKAIRINGVNELLIVASEKLDTVFKDQDVEVVHNNIKGSDLVGLEYEPLMGVNRGVNAHLIWHAPYVSSEDGSGIVHLAPAYGEEDFILAQKHNIPIVHTIDQNGYFTEGAWRYKNVWDVNKQIAKDLKEQGIVYKIDYIRHSYPHCHRCGTKLMYRAHPSWFMDIDNQRQLMLENNKPINWFPSHLKHGRFEKTILQAPDWNLSRDRFWATAMPVWKSPSGKGRVVGSYQELKDLSGVELNDYHRPWIDDVKFTIDGEEYVRIDKVMDSWFEAGSMPFAQLHYPFENKEKFEDNFPGDFIVEYIAQTRAWFYYMHAVSTALFGTNSFKNVITTGTLAGSDGRKMSKSLGNYTDPNELMDKYSADSERFLLLSCPVLNGEDFSLQDKEVGDVARKLSMIWNMYDFFTMYAEVDGWEWSGKLEDPIEQCTNPLDIWVISRLHQLVDVVETNMDKYDIPNALAPILPFLDDASNWFVRRSRRRFWKSEDDDDKQMAYKTLHYVLVRLAFVMAPFTPFLSEELHHNLTGDKESIHLKDWLPAGRVNELVMNDMETVRNYVNQGLGMRAKAGIKVRQPLKSVTVPSLGQYVDFESILKEELNVKKVNVSKKPIKLNEKEAKMFGCFESEVYIDKSISPELKREGLMREVIRSVQSARKQAGLNVDDRIKLHIKTDDKQINQALGEHQVIIQAETLAVEISGELDSPFRIDTKIEGSDVQISIQKQKNN